ncbi:PD-(D/E)XK nuclease family transposase [Oceanobacillus salinisoli]
MDKRFLYYSAKLYEEQLGKGEDYRKLSRVIAVRLMRIIFH